LEIEKDADADKIRHWLDLKPNGKVKFQYFIANHAGVFSGWDTQGQVHSSMLPGKY